MYACVYETCGNEPTSYFTSEWSIAEIKKISGFVGIRSHYCHPSCSSPCLIISILCLMLKMTVFVVSAKCHTTTNCPLTISARRFSLASTLRSSLRFFANAISASTCKELVGRMVDRIGKRREWGVKMWRGGGGALDYCVPLSHHHWPRLREKPPTFGGTAKFGDSFRS